MSTVPPGNPAGSSVLDRLSAQQYDTIHVAFAVAHDFSAPHLLKPLRALDGDVVDVRTVVRIERDEAS